jgi:hypothetical protein
MMDGRKDEMDEHKIDTSVGNYFEQDTNYFWTSKINCGSIGPLNKVNQSGKEK